MISKADPSKQNLVNDVFPWALVSCCHHKQNNDLLGAVELVVDDLGGGYSVVVREVYMT